MMGIVELGKYSQLIFVGKYKPYNTYKKEKPPPTQNNIKYVRMFHSEHN